MNLPVLSVSGRASLTIGAQVLASIVGILAVSISLFAQSNQGRILGTVRDAIGRHYCGRYCHCNRYSERASRRTLTTDEAGEYAAPNLDPSTYRVRVEFKGFKTYDRQGLDIAVGQEAKIDVTMQPGEQNQTVTVTEAIPLVETTSATLTGNIESSEDRRSPAEWPQLRQLAHASPWICQSAGRRRRQSVQHGPAARRLHVPDRRSEHV